MNFDQDRFLTPEQVTFAANTGAGTGGTLAASANNAIAAVVRALRRPRRDRGGAVHVRRPPISGDRPAGKVAVEGTVGGFDDETDLLIDITGAIGTIGASDFGPSDPP